MGFIWSGHADAVDVRACCNAGAVTSRVVAVLGPCALPSMRAVPHRRNPWPTQLPPCWRQEDEGKPARPSCSSWRANLFRDAVDALANEVYHNPAMHHNNRKAAESCMPHICRGWGWRQVPVSSNCRILFLICSRPGSVCKTLRLIVHGYQAP